jgi:FkbM family methyltransferase
MCLGYFFHGGLRHEAGVERVLRKSLRPGSVFVDVGANIGLYTRLASRIVGPSGRVYAMEPQPAALRLLQANARDLPNTTILPLAIGEQSGEMEFFIKEKGDTSSFDPDGAASSVRVPVSTLDRELSTAARVDLVKIDVEGFEMEVLRGAVETLRRHRPLVCFEFVTDYAARRGFTIDDYRAVFAPFGYTLQWIEATGRGPSLTSETPSSDILATPL